MNRSAVSSEAEAIISLSTWIERVGITACTAWRWRRRGWLKTINIAGRQYLTAQAVREFHDRAVRGDFAQAATTPERRGLDPDPARRGVPEAMAVGGAV